MLNGGPVVLRLKREAAVAFSLTEAKYITLTPINLDGSSNARSPNYPISRSFFVLFYMLTRLSILMPSPKKANWLFLASNGAFTRPPNF